MQMLKSEYEGDSSVIVGVLSTYFDWSRTSCKPRPLPVYDQLRPRPLLFLELLNILGTERPRLHY